MRLKCLFCKYKAVCIPEQESNLTAYKKLQKMYMEVIENYRLLAQENTELGNLLANKEEDLKDLKDAYNGLNQAYTNLKSNLENFIIQYEQK